MVQDEARNNPNLRRTVRELVSHSIEALEELRETDWGPRLKEQMDETKLKQKTEIARKAYAEVRSLKKTNPTDFDRSIPAAEQALKLAEDTSYESAARKLLETLTIERINTIGLKAYEAVRARLKKSPKDYAGNVAFIKEQLAKAKDSRYEAKIAKSLRDQELRLERERQKAVGG